MMDKNIKIEYPYNLMKDLGLLTPSEDQINGLNYVISKLDSDSRCIIYKKYLKCEILSLEEQSLLTSILKSFKSSSNFSIIKQGVNVYMQYLKNLFNDLQKVDYSKKEYIWLTKEQSEERIEHLIENNTLSPFDSNYLLKKPDIKIKLKAFSNNSKASLGYHKTPLIFDLSNEAYNMLKTRYHYLSNICNDILQNPVNWFYRFEKGSLNDEVIFELYYYLYKCKIIDEYTFKYLCKYIDCKENIVSYFKINRKSINMLFEDFICLLSHYDEVKIKDMNQKGKYELMNRLKILYDRLPNEEKVIFDRHYIKKEPFLKLLNIEKSVDSYGFINEDRYKYIFDEDYFNSFIEIFMKFYNDKNKEFILYGNKKLEVINKKIKPELFEINIWNCEDLSFRIKNCLNRNGCIGYMEKNSVGYLLRYIYLNPYNWFKLRNFGIKSITELLDFLYRNKFIDLEVYSDLLSHAQEGNKNGKLV